MKTVCFCNQKGGVTKSTSAAEAAVLLAGKGHRVLAVDLDPQGNLSDILEVKAGDDGSAYEVLRGDVAMGDVIAHAAPADVLPSDISLAMLEPVCSRQITKWGSLHQQLRLWDQRQPSR